MKILIVAATEEEIKPHFSVIKHINELRTPNFELRTLITGVGMVATAFHLAEAFSVKHYDYVINIGIAGSFIMTLKIGEVVNVVKDRFSEMGAEDGDKFTPIDKIAQGFTFAKGETFELINTSPINSKVAKSLKQVSGITVNTVHGNEQSIKKVFKLFNPDIETMEGAAFMYACQRQTMTKICPNLSLNPSPYLQIRAISNYVEKRNKSSWNIPLAIDNLTKTISEIINEIINKD